MAITARVLRRARPFPSSIILARPAERLPASIRFASSDYGSPTGGPISENPKEQGPNPSADKEHPGPPPPKPGQDTGLSGTKKGAKGHNTPNAQSDVRPSVGNEPTQGKKSFSTSAMSQAEAKDKPQPKILDETPPSDEDAPADVKKHNEEMANRADKAAAGAGREGTGKEEGVSKSFWQGHVGDKKGVKK